MANWTGRRKRKNDHLVTILCFFRCFVNLFLTHKHKHTHYREGGHRVFAVAHWPGKIKPGVTNALSSSLDLLPTIAKLTGATLRSDVSYDGMDLSNVLFNGATEAHETLFHPQYPNGNITAIRYKQYKVSVLLCVGFG